MEDDAIRIVDGGLDDPRVIALLVRHMETNVAVTPPGSVHAFDVGRLAQADVSFWSAWRGDALVGVGALKTLDPAHGEVKSMHTVSEVRRSGIGRAMLTHIIAVARSRGMKRLSLETGSFEFFRPAVALYERFGFVECEPFADYELDPNSTFMTLEL